VFAESKIQGTISKENQTMSQIPPPGQPSQPAYQMQPTQSNGWGLAALITGIMGFCTLGLGGLLAIIFGFLGIRKSKVTHTGGGMSIAGLIIGILSMIGWGVFYSIFGLAFLGISNAIKAQAPMRDAADHFVHDLSAGSLPSVQADTEGSIPDADLQSLIDNVKDLGAVQNVTSFITNATSDSCDLTLGTARFDKGSRTFTGHEVKKGDAWKISAFSFNESPSPTSAPTSNP
jgi:hypothetical protein